MQAGPTTAGASRCPDAQSRAFSDEKSNVNKEKLELVHLEKKERNQNGDVVLDGLGIKNFYT